MTSQTNYTAPATDAEDFVISACFVGLPSVIREVAEALEKTPEWLARKQRTHGRNARMAQLNIVAADKITPDVLAAATRVFCR